MIAAIASAGAGVVPVIEFRRASTTAEAVAAFCADHVPPLDPSGFVGVDAGAADLLLIWAYDHGAGALVEDLDRTQAALIDAIKSYRDDQRLGLDLRAEYPAASGHLFGVSAASQDNWSKLATLDAQGAVAYPFAVTTWDERGSYDLVDTTDREAATLAISTVVLTERATAEGYIGAVLAASSAADARAAAAPYLASP